MKKKTFLVGLVILIYVVFIVLTVIYNSVSLFSQRLTKQNISPEISYNPMWQLLFESEEFLEAQQIVASCATLSQNTSQS